MIKIILAMFLAFMLTLGVSPLFVNAATIQNAETINVAARDSADIPEWPSAWAAADVNAAIAAGLVPPTLQSRYTRAATRTEFAALAVTLYEMITGREIATDEAVTFTDTDDINVQKAATIEVVSGIGNNRFEPDTLLTREQATAMLSRLVYKFATEFSMPIPYATAEFADSGSISDWAADGVKTAVALNIIRGTGDDNFDPQGECTREQSIVIILRLYKKMEDIKEKTIYPITHVVNNHIGSVGECEFVIKGFYVAEKYGGTNLYIYNYVMINSIQIRSLNGKFSQLIDGFSTQYTSNYGDSNNYGFDFGDWNADGINDIKLHHHVGGTMRNEPSLFWLWDTSNAKFTLNEQLGEISSYSTVFLEPEKDSRVRSYFRGSPTEFFLSYYEYADGRFTKIEEEHGYTEEQDGVAYQVTQISNLSDGELKLVDEFRTQIDES